MKRLAWAVRLLALFAAGNVQAAVFPAPYCVIDFPAEVEPITRVSLAYLDHHSGATPDGSPASEDFTTLVARVQRGSDYTLSVEGNTNGRFVAVVTAYIDWNGDALFDGPEETYALGSIVGSTGSDGQQVSAVISVPPGVPLGDLRLRVTKKFHDAAGPCNTTGYGQAEDYTLHIGPEMIFKASFDGVVVDSGAINLPILSSYGPSNPLYLTWIGGATCSTYGCAQNIAFYNNNAGLTFIWSHAPASEGAVSFDGGMSFAILASGERVGPLLDFARYSSVGAPFNWRAGADGYLGFTFDCSSLGVPPPGMCYGYAHLVTTAPDGYPATLIEYSYNSGGDPIIIP